MLLTHSSLKQPGRIDEYNLHVFVMRLQMVHLIGLNHDSRYVGFQIIMQISYVLCWGANIGKKANCGKSARRDIEIILLKVTVF